MLNEITLFGNYDKVLVAIERLRSFEPPEGYFLAFSGGKDSVTIKALADMAGVKYDAHYSLTTVDPPELVQFIKREHKDVFIDRPDKSMWQIISLVKRMPPTRRYRYCCEKLKETGGAGRIVVTGIRQQESVKRSKRRMVEQCWHDTHKTYLNVIIDWSESEVWEFIKKYKIPYCCLYDEGFSRLGCIGCPMATSKGQKKEFDRWPKYKKGYIRAFNRMIDRCKGEGKPVSWQTGEEVMDWWLSPGKTVLDDQMVMFE